MAASPIVATVRYVCAKGDLEASVAQPLADILWAQGTESPDAAATPFVDATKEVPDVAAALAGARDICAERLADMAEARGLVRQAFATKAVVKSSVVTPKPTEPTKFEQYYDFEENISEMPSHRFLAIRRGQTEGVLFMRLVVDAAPLVARLEEIAGVNPRSPLAEELRLAAADAYKRLIAPACELDATMEKKLASDRCSPRTCAICCSPRRSAKSACWPSIRASAPAARWRCSTRRESFWSMT